MDITQIIDRIKKITKTDMQHKSINELFLSVAEEFGELAKEIKVENEVFCNAHKTLDEGSAGESVDLFIVTAAMIFAIDENKEINTEYGFRPFGCDVLESFNNIGESISSMKGNILNCCRIMLSCMDIYFATPNTTDETFLAYVNKKLDKWEANQTRELSNENH